MNYEVKVIKDSVSSIGKRLTTITATYPRFIHSEVLTHRDRARNSASSRAIPFNKLRDIVITSPVIPLSWGMEQSGMQTGEEIPEALRPLANAIWLAARDEAIEYATMLHNISDTAHDNNLSARILKYLSVQEREDLDKWCNDSQKVRIHKSLPNRIIEPWMWITVVMTATEWNNFFRLRCHPHAEQHFQKIAGMIKDALKESVPKVNNDWHLPYIQEDEWSYDIETLKRMSVARCARVSYLTHEGKRDVVKDLELFDKLNIGSGKDLPHASPYEHVARALPTLERSGPFIGWHQFRKDFPNENVETTYTHPLIPA